MPSTVVAEGLLRHHGACDEWMEIHRDPGLYEALTNSLEQEQKGLCAYTEELLIHRRAVEHVRPRNPSGQGTDLHSTWDYSNLLLVHKTGSYGESGKGNQFEESRFLSPLRAEDCAHLVFLPSGEIQAPNAIERFSYTNSLLSLNHPKLKQGRSNLWRALEFSMKGGLPAEAIREHYLKLNDLSRYEHSYPSVTEAFLADLDV